MRWWPSLPSWIEATHHSRHLQRWLRPVAAPYSGGIIECASSAEARKDRRAELKAVWAKSRLRGTHVCTRSLTICTCVARSTEAFEAHGMHVHVHKGRRLAAVTTGAGQRCWDCSRRGTFAAAASVLEPGQRATPLTAAVISRQSWQCCSTSRHDRRTCTYHFAGHVVRTVILP